MKSKKINADQKHQSNQTVPQNLCIELISSVLKIGVEINLKKKKNVKSKEEIKKIREKPRQN